MAAAQAAAQALDRATEAHERAGTAEQNAQAALDSVNTKNAIYFDFDPPSGQGSKEGDVWWQRGDNGAVIGMWVWLDGTWNKGDVASEMIANLDVGKLTIGAGTAIDLEVTQRFSAAIAEIIELEAKNLKAEEIWGDSAWLGQARVNMLTVGAISPDMLAMGTDELAPNPTFSNAALWNKAPFLNTGPGITSTNTQSYVDPGSNRAPWFNDLSAAGSSIPVTLPQPCAGGDRFYVSMEALHWSTVGDKVLRFEAEFFDRNMDRVSGDGPELRGSDANATAYHNRQKVVVAPATASFVRFHLTIVSGTVGQFIIRRVSVRRAMTAVSGGQRVEISPAGLALWTAAATSLPNAELTAAKGLVLRDNAGNSTMWIDSLTGELHISGGVTSGGKIIGSSFEGGDIDIRTAIGAPVFKADPNGVKIGGTIPVLQVPFNPPYSFTGTTGSLDAPAISGGVYKVTWILTRSSAVDNQFHFVGFRWLDSAGATISSFTSLHDYIAPTTVGSALAHYITLRAPERAATLRIEIWREGGTAVTTRMHSTKVELVGPGDIDIAGSVSASEGDFTRLDAEYGFIGPIRYSEDEATVHGDIEVNGRFKFIIPDPLTITGATNNQITSSGWAPLPTNVSTTFRANYPMWVEIRAGGALVIPPGGNIRLSAIVSGATIIGAIDEGGWGSTVWGQNSSSSSGNLVMTGAGSRVVLLNEGLHTIYLVAQRAADVSGSAVNYPVLQIIPLRWH